MVLTSMKEFLNSLLRDKKKLLVILVLTGGLIVAAVLVRVRQELRRRAAVTGVDFSLVSSKSFVNPGDNFTVDVVMNTNEYRVSATEIHIAFDSNYLEAQSMQGSGFLPVVLPPGAQVGSGTASIILGANPGDPKQGSATIATIDFLAKSPSGGATQIRFDSGTQTAALGNAGDVTRNLNSTQVTVLGATTSTPTPQPGTSTPTATRTPTPTPRPTGEPPASPQCTLSFRVPSLTSTPTKTPTPTNTKTPTPTPTKTPTPTPTKTPTPTPTKTPTPTPTKTPTPTSTKTPTPTSTNTPTPTSTPPPTAICREIKAYDANWNPLSASQLTKLAAGDKVRFTVLGSTSAGIFDKAIFQINGTLTNEVTDKKPGTQEFYFEYTITTEDLGQTITVNAWVHHAGLDTWF